MRIPTRIVLPLGLLVFLAPPLWGQSLSLGSVDAPPGATVEIPVNVSVSEDLVGLHLRLKYDPDALFSPRVEKGPLLNEGHLVEYASPKEGELNIVAYSPSGGEPFNGQEGAVLFIGMTLSDFAAPGSHSITFATPVVDAVTIPPTGLSGTTGNSISHTISEGAVRIEGLSDGDLDGNEELDGFDLLLFSLWWRDAPDSSNSLANVIQSPETDLIEARDLLRLIHLWKNSTAPNK